MLRQVTGLKAVAKSIKEKTPEVFISKEFGEEEARSYGWKVY